MNSTPPCAPSIPIRRSSGKILPRLEKSDLRPALLGQAEIDPCGGKIDQLAGVIDGKIVVGFVAKLAEPLLILQAHPSRHGDVDGFEHALYAVFILQPERHDLELQLADGAQDQIVVAQRLE